VTVVMAAGAMAVTEEWSGCVVVPGGARAVTEECIGNDVAGSLDDCGFGQ